MKSDASSNKNPKIPFYSKHIKITLFLLLLVLLSLGYFLVVNPQKNRYNQAKNDIQSKKQEIESGQAINRKINNVIKQYGSVSPLDRQRLSDVLPLGSDKSSIFVNIESIAKQAGIDVSVISVSDHQDNTTSANRDILKQADNAPSQATYQLAEAQITAGFENVNYISLKKLLNLIESNLRILDIQNFSFNPEESKLELNLKAYYLK